MSDLYNVFKNLCAAYDDGSYFNVEDVYPGLHHKIGCSREGYPMIFVECTDDTPTTNIKLKLFAVNFNQLCKLKEGDEEPVARKYTIIQLKSVGGDFQKYFIEVMSIVLRRISPFPTVKELKKEVGKVIALFTATPAFSKQILKGLWAELFVIAHSSSPGYLINAWHVSPDDKYDFNDGIDKIEVKSTSNMDRVHTFSLEQLNPNIGSNLIICSIIAIESGKGANIFDLIDVISNILSDPDDILKVQEITYATLGPHIDEAKSFKIDQKMAVDSYALYDYKDIPTIKKEDIPMGVSAVHFSSMLKDCKTFNIRNSQSELHKAL